MPGSLPPEDEIARLRAAFTASQEGLHVDDLLSIRADWQAIRQMWDAGHLSGDASQIGKCHRFYITKTGRIGGLSNDR